MLRWILSKLKSRRTRMNTGVKVVLYTRPGCTLCDKAKTIIMKVSRNHPIDLQEVDISSDPNLVQAYGESIPVVCIDGVEVFRGKVSEYRLQRELRERQGGGRHIPFKRSL